MSQVCETVATELSKLHKWFQIKKLYLNIGTFLRVFGKKQCEDNHVVSINCMNINRVWALCHRTVVKFGEIHTRVEYTFCTLFRNELSVFAKRLISFWTTFLSTENHDMVNFKSMICVHNVYNTVLSSNSMSFFKQTDACHNHNVRMIEQM